LKDAIGLVRNIFHRAEDPDQPVELVVIRLEVVVRNRPVVAESVEATPLEVVRSHAERDAAPMIRAPAEHPAAEPVERRAFRLRVRLAVEIPSTDATVELAERPGRRCRAAARRDVRPRPTPGNRDGIPQT